MSANKSRGTAWETSLVRYFRSVFRGRYGLAPRRVAQEGFNDSGDVHGVSPFTIQAKNYRSWETAIREGLDGAERQKAHAREPFGVAMVKRARKGTGYGYAVMTARTWALLVLRLRSAEARLEEASPALYSVHVEETTRDLDAAGWSEPPRGDSGGPTD